MHGRFFEQAMTGACLVLYINFGQVVDPNFHLPASTTKRLNATPFSVQHRGYLLYGRSVIESAVTQVS